MTIKSLTATALAALLLLGGCATTPAPAAEQEDELMPDSKVSQFNIFDLPQLPLEDELVTALVENKSVYIERIVSTGQETDWYDQEEHEYVILVEGTARIEYEDGSLLELNAGDTLMIPAHQKHRVAYTSSEPPCIWVCVFWND